jgi:hypothetical protein
VSRISLSEFANNLCDEFSEDVRWVAYVAGLASGVLAVFGPYVFLELSTVRPLLVFVLVGGQPPPICGF